MPFLQFVCFLWGLNSLTRPQDKPIDFQELGAEDQAIIKQRYPELIKNE